MPRLRDRAAVVTGGASGIGAAIARALAAEGAHVAVADVRPVAEAAGMRGVACDVTRAADVESLRAATDAREGPARILVLAAGVGAHERLAGGDPGTWARVVDVNVLGALRVLRAFLPGMTGAGGGDVVFISSVSARRPYPHGAAYAASKAALDAVAETLRLEELPRVRVTRILPGIVDTPFFERAAGHPGDVGSLGWGALAPDDVAEAVLFAVTRPPGVAVSEIVVRPSAQPF